MINAFISGFGLSLSLILAIGAQNAFVLKQGLKNERVFLVCAICALSDAILIFSGVAGMGYLIERFPAFASLARWGGFAFLLAYGARSLWSALRDSHAMKPADAPRASVQKTLALTLAFTWLNPHVYLDTLVLVGAVAGKYAPLHWIFGAGAAGASFAFFFSLGYGAKALAPAFARPLTWKIFEGLVGVVMIILAFAILPK